MNADFFYGLLFQSIYILIHIPAVLLFMRAFDPYARTFPFTKRNFEKVWKGEKFLFENLKFHVLVF